MMKKQRQSAILALLNATEGKTLTTTEIAKKMNVASMTIRRDLNDMAKEKLITRIYGGASLVNEKTTKEKTQVQRESKIEIGRIIGSLILPKMTVFLGAGTTIYASADFLPKTKDINYVTNSDLIFRYLVSKDINVLLTGGFYHRTTNEFVGTIADHTKFGKGDSFSFAELKDFDGLITDSKASRQELKILQTATKLLVGKG